MVAPPLPNRPVCQAVALAIPAEEAAPVEINTVKELKLLKYKLELGLISEEDYQQQQKELIEKL